MHPVFGEMESAFPQVADSGISPMTGSIKTALPSDLPNVDPVGKLN